MNPKRPAARMGDGRGRRTGRSGASLAMAALLGGVVGVSALVLPGAGQPDRPGRASQPEGAPGRGPGRGPAGAEGPPMSPPMSPEDLRARLERRLEDVRLIEKRLEEGLASLDAGATPEDVMRGLFAPGLRWGMDAGGPRGPEGRGPLTPEELDRLMQVIRERMPRVAEWIAQMEHDEPRLVEAVASRLAPQIREIERLAERDPEGARVRTAELIATIGVMRETRMYRAAVARDGTDSPGGLAARASLRAALVEQFDARLAAREHEVEALGRRLESLRADITSETGQSDRLIDAALERITQDALRPEPAQGQDGRPPAPPGG